MNFRFRFRFRLPAPPAPVLLPALATLIATVPATAQRVAPVHLGGEAYTLTSGPLSVEVGPTKGARIRSLKFDGNELFYQDSSGSPSSHGSTFWPGPQAYWTANCRTAGNNGCWPPPTPFDGANTTYTGELRGGDTTVTYVSGSHQATGIRLRKTTWANLEDTSISIRYHIVNTSENEVAFSPWEVTRFPSGGLLFWPRSDEDTLQGNGASGATLMNMVRDTLGVKWFRYDSTSIPTSGTAKIWDGGTEGWFARVDQSRLLYIKKFTDVPSAKKPPHNENEIEIYTSNRSGASGGMALLEMEVHGPFDTIAVGDSSEWDMKWYVRPLPENLVIGSNEELLAFAREVVAEQSANIAARHERNPAGRRTGSLNVRGGLTEITLDRSGVFELSLLDTRGRFVQNLHSGQLDAGTHAFAIGDLPRGVHRVVLRERNGTGIRTIDSRLLTRL